jgi:hypothetical protein
MCIVDSAKLDVTYFTAVCLNKQDVYEAANNGDNFITAYKAFTSLSPSTRQELFNKPGAFMHWCKTVLALPDSQDKRVRQIFARPVWRQMCKQWNETQWGRQMFKLYNFCQGAAQHIDHVSPPLYVIDRLINFINASFTGVAARHLQHLHLRGRPARRPRLGAQSD